MGQVQKMVQEDAAPVELQMHSEFTSLRRLGRVGIVNFEAYLKVPEATEHKLQVDSLSGKISCALSFARNTSGLPTEVIIRRRGWTEFESDRAAKGFVIATVPGATMSTLQLTKEAQELGWKQHGKELFSPQDVAGTDSDIKILTGAVTELNRAGEEHRSEIATLLQKQGEMSAEAAQTQASVDSVSRELAKCSDNVDCLSSEVRGTQGQLNSVEGDLSELRATVIGLSDELDTNQSTQADTNAAVNAEIVKAVGSIDALSEKLEECSAKIDWVRAEQERTMPITEAACSEANIDCWKRASEVAGLEHQRVEQAKLRDMIIAMESRHETTVKALQADNEALRRRVAYLESK